jgi:hypothetical protein
MSSRPLAVVRDLSLVLPAVLVVSVLTHAL